MRASKDKNQKREVIKMFKKFFQKKSWMIISHTGRVVGKYKTLALAEKKYATLVQDMYDIVEVSF